MLTFSNPLTPEDSDELIWANLPDGTAVSINDEHVFEVNGVLTVVINGESDTINGVPHTHNRLFLTLADPGTYQIRLTAPEYAAREYSIEVE